MYVIQNIDTGKYVTRPGSAYSYSKRLEDAQVYRTREAAENSGVCSNERVCSVASLMVYHE